ncbi:hypothetical protein AQUCO_00200215v1 [Aquilegia coerulea]|uniref:Uncharacterized protein n=1 Tax=Aquilegia coerulea TaxID=218851 RepID=A0A2G5F282_AQUCA|nr:hypothetical protein AQUCO_00200215v1 [Aquilegia coerulea]
MCGPKSLSLDLQWMFKNTSLRITFLKERCLFPKSADEHPESETSTRKSLKLRPRRLLKQLTSIFAACFWKNTHIYI